MKPNLGLGQKESEEVIEALNRCLATTYALYLKTQNFHWNLLGDHFFSLHILFEKQYEEMADAVDEIAERIRALGGVAMGSFSAFQHHSLIPEPKATSWSTMVQELLEGHETLSRFGRPLITRFQELRDDASSDLLIRRLAVHEKAAWMLRSSISTTH